MTDSLLVLAGPPAFSSFRLDKLCEQMQSQYPGVRGLYAEFVHYLHLQVPLSASQREHLNALLDYGPKQSLPAPVGLLLGSVTPRSGTISPWSSKATDILRGCELPVHRVERGVRWYVDGLAPVEALGADMTALLYDRMTQQFHPAAEAQAGGLAPGNAPDDAALLASIFAEHQPAPLGWVTLGADPLTALAAANRDLGLALSDDELAYLAASYAALGRDPTDVELMMFAQANSEHCRHKIFNASWQIDGEAAPLSLFGMIKNTHRHINGAGILSAYSDNAAVMEGYPAPRLWPDPDGHQYGYHDEPVHILMKVETHNHPTAIAPFPGAATGSGGEIRDEGAVGRGSKPKAGLTGFTTSHLNLPELPQPWELDTGRPERIQSALDIMLDGPIGAAAFNNEFGRPALNGYFRTFEYLPDANDPTLVRGYHKPVMIAGGVGNIRAEHVHAIPFVANTKLIVLGGPAMLIGLGGGAASSMASGQSSSELDFASVQRENPEMERRCQEVIDACWALGEQNPIRLIHDVGAGGLSNALPELVKDADCGGRFELRAVPNAEPGMAPVEIWCNEAQERYVLGVAAEDLPRFRAICARERCPHAVVGEAELPAVGREPRLEVRDTHFDNKPVDLPMAVLFGKPPKMERAFTTQAWPVGAAAPSLSLGDAIARVLQFPAVASKQFLITIGDRSITGMVARDQMVGPWQVPVADQAITTLSLRSHAGEAMAMGERSPLALISPAASARMAVAEALTNLGGVAIESLDRVVLSANWMAAAGQGQEDQALYEAVHAVGMELCPALGIAIPVGKDSLSMRTQWQTPDGADREVRAPLTLIVSAFAPVPDVRQAVTPWLRLDQGDTRLLLIDLGNGRNRLGGSALAQVCGELGGQCPDVDDPAQLKAFMQVLGQLLRDDLLLAYHDRSDGGLLACLWEMAFAGHCGVDVDLTSLGGSSADTAMPVLFAEELGAVIQVRSADLAQVQAALAAAGMGGITHNLGAPTIDQTLRLRTGETVLLEQDRGAAQALWARTSYQMQRRRDNPESADEEYAAIFEPDPGQNVALSFDPNDDVVAPYINRGERPKVAVLREQGVNGQLEMAGAFMAAGFDAIDVHMSDLLAGRQSLDAFQALVACGGFSYGDVLGAGGGWAKSVLFHPQAAEMFAAFFARDTLSLGVCNGCQMLSQLSGMIPGAGDWPRFVRNRSEQFEARTSLLRINTSSSPWLDGMAGSVLPVAVAHGEGQAEFAAESNRAALAAAGQIAMQYVDHHHQVTARYPFNPNGSVDGITGLTSADGRALIMMPHPERVYRAVSNSWRPDDWAEDGPWLRLFRNAGRALLS